jgi:hypothetical protein
VTIAAAQAVWEVLSGHIPSATPNTAPPAVAPKKATHSSRIFALEER